MGNVSELLGDLDSNFSLVRAEKVGSMVPPRTSNNLWTVLRPDPADGRDAAASL